MKELVPHRATHKTGNAAASRSLAPNRPSLMGKLEGYGGVQALPAFRAPYTASQATGRRAFDENSQLFKWTNEYLELNVLPSLNDLIVSDDPPTMPLPSPRARHVSTAAAPDAAAHAGENSGSRINFSIPVNDEHTISS